MIEGLHKSFFDKLIERSRDVKGLKKIILFGSYARGDFNEKSDIDLALDFEENSPNWNDFYFWVKDDYETLKEFDLVDMRSASNGILKSIKEEGIILYEN